MFAMNQINATKDPTNGHALNLRTNPVEKVLYACHWIYLIHILESNVDVIVVAHDGNAFHNMMQGKPSLIQLQIDKRDSSEMNGNLIWAH